MFSVRIVSDPQDSAPRPATRTMSDALSKLTASGELAAGTRIKLLAQASERNPTYSSALSFRSAKGDDVLFALPLSRGFWATGTLGDQRYFALNHLHDAEVDLDGNVQLSDGSYVHNVSLDVLSLHFRLPELEESIVYLTIRYLKAEAQCIRNDYGFAGIDYSALPSLRVDNVQSLTRHINQNISELAMPDSKPLPTGIRIATVHRVLDITAIQKVCGRPPLNRRMP